MLMVLLFEEDAETFYFGSTGFLRKAKEHFIFVKTFEVVMLSYYYILLQSLLQYVLEVCQAIENHSKDCQKSHNPVLSLLDNQQIQELAMEEESQEAHHFV